MKLKKKMLLPLVVLFTVLMTCSAFAKPRLSRTKVVYQKHSFYENGNYLFSWYRQATPQLVIKGLSKNAKILTTNYKKTYWTTAEYYKGKWYVDVTDRNVWMDQNHKAGKFTLKVKAKVKKGGKTKTYTLPFTLVVQNTHAQQVAKFYVGGKDYSKAFKKLTNGIRKMSLPVNKPVRITYTGKTKDMKKQKTFTVYSGIEENIYKKGSIVTLHHGDKLVLGEDDVSETIIVK